MVSGKKLTDEELAALGVSRSETEFGYEIYTVPCFICGLPVRTWTYSTERVYKCKLCMSDALNKQHMKKKVAKEQHERLLAEDIGVDYNHLHRFETAVSYFGLEYLPAIQQAEKVMHKFESVPEVVACIELLHIGARVIPHQKVGSYTVDFCLPDEKLVVEIDGSIYHANADKEFRRDYALKNMLGDGWDIKHIPADDLTRKRKVFSKGMKKLLEDRRFELRTK